MAQLFWKSRQLGVFELHEEAGTLMENLSTINWLISVKLWNYFPANNLNDNECGHFFLK